MLGLFLDIIAPIKCHSCNKGGHFLCKKCIDDIQSFEQVCFSCKQFSGDYKTCKTCQKYVYYNQVIVMKHYKSKNFGRLIKQSKYYGKKGLSKELGKYLYLYVKKYLDINDIHSHVILSVPSHYSRKIKRGYIVTDIIAKEFSNYSKILYKNSLKKSKYKKQQSKLSRKNRLTNIVNSFKIINNKDIIGKNIILIDDVVSTGSTINEISRILEIAGAKSISVVVLASN